ncbi:type 1 fimbrial protein [Burkholderia territorii]|nr:type 1 fimbrial protein [Burkholderia territorii]
MIMKIRRCRRVIRCHMEGSSMRRLLFVVAFTVAIPTAFHLLPAVRAEDGVANFQGMVEGATCKINGEEGNQGSFTVKVGTLPLSAFRNVGEIATKRRYTITLTDCTPPSGRVSVYFEPGPTINQNTGQLINTGTAQNIELSLLNSDFSKINLAAARGAQNSQQVNIVDGSATLVYWGGYVATSLPVIAGTFNTSVTYILDFE